MNVWVILEAVRSANPERFFEGLELVVQNIKENWKQDERYWDKIKQDYGEGYRYGDDNKP